MNECVIDGTILEVKNPLFYALLFEPNNIRVTTRQIGYCNCLNLFLWTETNITLSVLLVRFLRTHQDIVMSIVLQGIKVNIIIGGSRLKTIRLSALYGRRIYFIVNT